MKKNLIEVAEVMAVSALCLAILLTVSSAIGSQIQTGMTLLAPVDSVGYDAAAYDACVDQADSSVDCEEVN